MFDIEKAKDSMAKIQEADLSLGVLTRDERQNLVALMEDWWQREGWDLEELRQGAKMSNPYQSHQN